MGKGFALGVKHRNSVIIPCAKIKITPAYPDEALVRRFSSVTLLILTEFCPGHPRPARDKAFIIINFTGVWSNYGGGTPQVSPTLTEK